jgi:phage shock protein PspC (stress-responsive transcriptional regulator)
VEYEEAMKARSQMAPRKTEKKENYRRLFKSRKDRILDGVCGGVAEYLNVQPAVVRIAWLFLLFVHGLGIILYLLAMILVPVNPDHKNLPREDRPKPSFELVGGLVLMFIGFCVLLNWASDFWGWEFPNLMPWGWWHPFPWRFVFPCLLILIGSVSVMRAARPRKGARADERGAAARRNARDGGKTLGRSETEKVIGGVCGGIGLYFNIDPTLVRILYALFSIGTGVFFGILLYFALMIVMPRNGYAKPSSTRR